jgi:outer membrane protein OmpA-like peptidoglycan-associated protein
MMNRILGVILLGISLQAQAQPGAPTTRPAGKNIFPSNERWGALGLRAQGQDFYVSEARLQDTCNCDPQTWQNRGNTGLTISYYRSTGTRLAYSFDLGFSTGRVGTKPVPTLLAIKDRFTTFRGDLYYNMGPANQPVTPYLHTGLHAQFGTFFGSIPTGLGFRYTSSKRPIMLTGEVNYGWGISNQLRNSLIVGVGMYIRLKGSKPAANPKTAWGGPAVAEVEAQAAACVDSDFDGVPDGSDKCPKLPGSPLNAGCPNCDTDKDGIVDEKDECPTVPGPIESKGCPVRIVRDTIHVSVPAPTTHISQELPTIHFRTGSAALDENAVQLSTRAATIVRNNPDNRYVVEGYSEKSKPAQKISHDQVMAVVNYLIEKEGIRSERLIPRSGLQGGVSNQVKIRLAGSGD